MFQKGYMIVHVNEPGSAGGTLLSAYMYKQNLQLACVVAGRVDSSRKTCTLPVPLAAILAPFVCKGRFQCGAVVDSGRIL